MGPWASVIVAVAAITAVFLVTMAFRGLINTLDGLAARCGECGKLAMLPLPVGRQRCWHCRHPKAHLPHRAAAN
jgi:hypothetical protein